MQWNEDLEYPDPNQDGSVAARASRHLRGQACNGVLIGMSGTIADLERQNLYPDYVSLVRERLSPMWGLLPEIERQEGIDNAAALRTLWAEFSRRLEELKLLMGDKSPMSPAWRTVQRRSAVDLQEAIIIEFNPDLDVNPRQL